MWPDFVGILGPMERQPKGYADKPAFLLTSCFRLSTFTSHCALPIGDDEGYVHTLIFAYGDRFFPAFWLRKYRPFHSVFRQHVERLLCANHSPTLMPGDDLIGTGWNIRKLKLPALISYGIVGVRNDHHFGIHPDVSTVTAQAHQTL